MSRGIRGGVTRRNILASLVGIIALLAAGIAQATNYTVNTTNDSSGAGNCSLRDAINAANGSPTSGSTCKTAGTGSDTITFRVTGTITLGSTLPTITDGGLTITGPNPASSAGITVSGNNAEQILQVDQNGALTLQYLTLTDGFVGGQSPFGGAIENEGTLNIANCTFSGNEASGTEDAKSAFGGAIDNTNRGNVTIEESTFSANVVTGGVNGVGIGGAISDSIGQVTITNSTFSANKAVGGGNARGEGGAVAIGGASGMTLSNVTFLDNTAVNGDGSPGRGGAIESSGGRANGKGLILAASTGGNCFVALDDDGYNIADDTSCGFTMTTSQVITPTSAIGLASGLGNNGGPTQTIALTAVTGGAYNFIPAASCTDADGNPLTTDQRGFTRPVKGTCSAGAYQYGALGCSQAFASNPNLTALLPVMFFPEYIYGVNDPNGGYKLKITGVTQDKKPTGFPLCPNAFWSGTTTYVRTNNEPLQPGPSGLLYSIEFTATDNTTGGSCNGAATVCVQDIFHTGQQCLAPLDVSYDATKCP